MTRRPREGLVHASGVLSDASLARLTAGATRSVFAPKSESARRVVAAVSRRDVRASLFFSSLAVVGSPGQGNYAAANADMDARVARTHRAGVPAVAIRWGAWAEIGMAATRRRLRAFPAANATGAGAIPPDVGAACLLALVRASRPEALVARVDWNIFAKNGAKDDGIFREMISDENSAETKERIEPATASTTSPRDVLASPSSARPRLPSSRGDVGRYESVVDAIADLVESCVGARVPADQPLMDAGLDSLAATELASAVAARFGVEIPGTFAFDHPNVDAMSRFVGSRVGVFAEDATTRPEDRFGIETEAPSKGFRSRAVSDSSVVVHVAAVASARSDANTNRRADDARVAPESRVLVDDGDIGSGSRVASSPTNPVAFGVFLPDVDRFDASFFGVGAEEATQMDPQHRLLLHCAGSAVDDVASNLRERDVRSFGVFVGVATRDYDEIKSATRNPIGPHTATSTASSVGPGRVAFACDLSGPALSVDTACSSSWSPRTSARAPSLSRALAAAAGANLIFRRNTASFSERACWRRTGDARRSTSPRTDTRADGCDALIVEGSIGPARTRVLGRDALADG